MTSIVPATRQSGVVNIREPAPQTHAASSSDPRHYDQGHPSLQQLNNHNQDGLMQVDSDLDARLNQEGYQQVNVAEQNDNGPMINAAWHQINAARSESVVTGTQATAALAQAADENQRARGEAERLVTAQAGAGESHRAARMHLQVAEQARIGIDPA